MARNLLFLFLISFYSKVATAAPANSLCICDGKLQQEYEENKKFLIELENKLTDGEPMAVLPALISAYRPCSDCSEDQEETIEKRAIFDTESDSYAMIDDAEYADYYDFLTNRFSDKCASPFKFNGLRCVLSF